MAGENPRAVLRAKVTVYRQAHQGLSESNTAAALADAADDLLDWMDENGIDPGDPPSCACGASHWTCHDPRERALAGATYCPDCGTWLDYPDHRDDCPYRDEEDDDAPDA